jgi:dCTP deaminase
MYLLLFLPQKVTRRKVVCYNTTLHYNLFLRIDMGLKADSWIREKSLKEKMIEPFESGQVGSNVVSYGVSSYGYDIRVGREFKIFTNVNSTVVDPKNFEDKNIIDYEGDICIVPPNSFALARTIEYFRIPKNVLAVCLGKSTYARCGIIVNVTPFEPEFEGHITIEISNTTPLPAKIYANEGIAQVLFFEGDTPCEVTYKDKAGKYQGQKGITLPRILK